jgi:adenylate cyclase, class 2
MLAGSGVGNTVHTASSCSAPPVVPGPRRRAGPPPRWMGYTQSMPKHLPAGREIEVKIRVRDFAALLQRLHRLGTRSRGRVFERNVLFDTGDSRFQKTGRLLRVRVEAPAPVKGLWAGHGGAKLTFKAPSQSASKSRYKENLEREAPVHQPDRFERRLRSLGFAPGFIYEKYRTAFRLGDLHLDLDQTPVGVFLELEGRSQAIDRVARALGFKARDYIRSTYWDLYVEERRHRGRIPRNMVFVA